jgi:hypothetical protein
MHQAGCNPCSHRLFPIDDRGASPSHIGDQKPSSGKMDPLC